jgi:ferredoxin
MPAKPKNPQSPSGPVKVGNLIVEVDRNLCIGTGTCVVIAPKAFALDNEGKSIVLDTADQEIKEILLEAARSCPVAAIILKKETGEKVFPV